MSGKKSQRKGRHAEHEIVRILRAAGYPARVLGMYDSGDVRWQGRLCEVKRPKRTLGWAYKLLQNGNHAIFIRADNEPWILIQLLGTYITEHGPQTKKVHNALDLPQEEDSLVD